MDRSTVPAHVEWGEVDESSSRSRETGSSASMSSRGDDSLDASRHVNNSSSAGPEHFKTEQSFEPSTSTASGSLISGAHLEIPSHLRLPTGGSKEPVTEELLKTMVDESMIAAIFSKGSAEHPDGCVPCYRHQTLSGCPNGKECVYCHMPHTPSSVKVRPSTVQRDLCRCVADSVERRLGDDREATFRACALLGAASPYLRKAIMVRIGCADELESGASSQCSSVRRSRSRGQVPEAVDRTLSEDKKSNSSHQSTPAKAKILVSL